MEGIRTRSSTGAQVAVTRSVGSAGPLDRPPADGYHLAMRALEMAEESMQFVLAGLRQGLPTELPPFSLARGDGESKDDTGAKAFRLVAGTFR